MEGMENNNGTLNDTSTLLHSKLLSLGENMGGITLAQQVYGHNDYLPYPPAGQLLIDLFRRRKKGWASHNSKLLFRVDAVKIPLQSFPSQHTLLPGYQLLNQSKEIYIKNFLQRSFVRYMWGDNPQNHGDHSAEQELLRSFVISAVELNNFLDNSLSIFTAVVMKKLSSLGLWGPARVARLQPYYLNITATIEANAGSPSLHYHQQHHSRPKVSRSASRKPVDLEPYRKQLLTHYDTLKKEGKVARKSLVSNNTDQGQQMNTQEKRDWVCMVGIMKEEEMFLDEWLAYHRFIGIDDFFLCDNGDGFPLAKFLKPHIDAGYLTVIEWPDTHHFLGYNNQFQCYDLAEFVMRDGNQSLQITLTPSPHPLILHYHTTSHHTTPHHHTTPYHTRHHRPMHNE